MLVKVIKQIKTTTEEIFYIEASSEEEAAQIVSSNKNLAGHIDKEENKQEELIYGIEANFTGYAKILAKHGKEEQHIVYSPTLNRKDIRRAMLEQIETFIDVRFSLDGTTAYVDHENGSSTWFLEVLEQPTITEQELKIKEAAKWLSAQMAKSRKDDEEDDDDPAIYDDKYFQFMDHLKKHG